jgi:hypothetical protein
LELRGEYCRASELLAVALAEEAQRINQRALAAIDLAEHAASFKQVTVAMAEQQQRAADLVVPLLDERPKALLGECIASCLAHRRARHALPRPQTTLSAIAQRWHLPQQFVDKVWQDFVLASGGAYTLALSRARRTILAGHSDDVAMALWRLALTDPVVGELNVVFEQPSAPRVLSAAAIQPEAADARRDPAASSDHEENADGGTLGAVVAAAIATATAAAEDGATDGEASVGVDGDLGGAGGLGFEEYLVLRCFVESTSLEEQFRFLWRLFDRDSDGILSKEDVQTALKLPAARLGWNETTTQRWLQWVLGNVRKEQAGSDPSKIGPVELRAALAKSTQLRTILMASEPLTGPV